VRTLANLSLVQRNREEMVDQPSLQTVTCQYIIEDGIETSPSRVPRKASTCRQE
jgi:hypothetical protein